MSKSAVLLCAGGLLVLVISLACLPLLLHGPLAGHDLPLILSWSQQFSAQLAGGELYPRWLPGLYGGAGGPVFFYYAPVPFYFTGLAALMLPQATALVLLGVGQWLMVLGSALSFCWFASLHTRRLAALAGALLYALAPYHFAVDLLYRQAMSEACAYIWLPLIFGSMDRMAAGRRYAALLALAFALLAMTHLPMLVLASPFFLLYGASCVRRVGGLRLIGEYSIAVLVGLLLAGVYLAPALLTQDAVAMDAMWSGAFDYRRWFLLDGEARADKALFASVGLTGLGVFTLSWCAVAWLSTGEEKEQRPLRLLTVLALVVPGIWLLMTPLSAALWAQLEALQKVQFPWRLLAIQDWALATILSLLVGQALSRGDQVSAILASVMLGCAALWAAQYLLSGYQQHIAASKSPAATQRLQRSLALGFGAPEHLPVTVAVSRSVLISRAAAMSPLEYDQRAGRVDIVDWRAREILLNVDLDTATALSVRQLYYPGWRAAITGQEQSLAVMPGPQYGLVSIQLPPGTYSLKLVLGPGASEKLGWGLSLLGSLGLLLLILPGHRWRVAQTGDGVAR